MKRFPLLSTIAALLTWIGWILFALGAILLLLVFGTLHFPAVKAIFGFAFLPSGVLLIALGESIRVGLAIEQNTLRSSQALDEMRHAMRADLQRDKVKTPAISEARP